jgi:hypothetical protein
MDIGKYIDDNLDELIDDPDGFIEKSLSITQTKLNPENEDTGEDDFVSELHQNFFENKMKKLSNKNILIEDDERNYKQNQNEKTVRFSKNTFEKNLTQENLDENQYENQDDNSYNNDIETSESLDEEEQDFNSRFVELEDEKSEEESNEKLGTDEENINEKKNLDINCVQEDSNDIGFYFRLMNVFMKHYNNKFEKADNFFTGVKDLQKDTSNPMELFFEAIIEYKQLKESILKDIEDDEIKENDESLNNLTMKFYFINSEKDKISNLFNIWEGQIYCLEYKNQKIVSPSLIVCLNLIMENNLFDKEWTIFNLRDY